MRFFSDIFLKIKTLFIIAILGSNPVFADTLNYEITAEKLNQSRNNLSTKTHSSSYNFNEEALQNLPLGEATSINQVLAYN